MLRRGEARRRDRRRRGSTRSSSCSPTCRAASSASGSRALLARAHGRGRRAAAHVQLPARGRQRDERAPRLPFASWDQGYGDMAAQPDLATIRTIPWLEKTALVLCDLLDEETGAPVEVSPRRILQRQVERAAAAGFTLKFASELEFFLFQRVARRGRGEGLHEPHAALARHRGLPHPADDARRVPDPRHPQRHRRRGRAGRVLEGRGRARASTRSTSCTRTRSRWPTAT